MNPSVKANRNHNRDHNAATASFGTVQIRYLYYPFNFSNNSINGVGTIIVPFYRGENWGLSVQID